MKNTLFIVWQASNDTGISIIDEQHRGIVSIINSLYYFLQQGDATAAFKPTLEMLNHYTNLHFTTEEKLIRAAGYGEMENHIALHRNFMSQIRLRATDRTSEDQAKELLHFLKDWWLKHINRNDREYIPAVRKHLGL